VTIGSHSRRHPRMTDLDPEAARQELRGSMERLESILGRPVRLFAFPFGSHNEDLVHACAEVGYHRAFSVVPSPMRPGSVLVGRVSVTPEDGPLEFGLKVRGAYDWLPTASRWKRRLLGRKGAPWSMPARARRS